MQKRRGGITFRMDKTFKHGALEVPEEELYQIACEVNVAEVAKQALLAIWFQRKHASAKQQGTSGRGVVLPWLRR